MKIFLKIQVTHKEDLWKDLVSFTAQYKRKKYF